MTGVAAKDRAHAEETRPLLLSAAAASACKLADVAITIHDDEDRPHEETPVVARYNPAFVYTSLRASSVSPKPSTTPFVYCQHPSPSPRVLPPLNRKYVTYPVEDPVGQKLSRSKVAAMYGSMPLKPDVDREDEDGSDDGDSNNNNNNRKTTLRSLLCKLDDPKKVKKDTTMASEKLGSYHSIDAPCSNQSETESDSDGSCGSNSTSSLQSILRIRDGIYACRKVRKHASVEFLLDIDDDEDKDKKAKDTKSSSLSCASSCMPRCVCVCFVLGCALHRPNIYCLWHRLWRRRRLTIEEKAALYRIRPDLQLTPMPLILRELEEIRRRRQRKLMFSILGGTLLMLMVIVFYYMLIEAQ